MKRTGIILLSLCSLVQAQTDYVFFPQENVLFHQRRLDGEILGLFSATEPLTYDGAGDFGLSYDTDDFDVVAGELNIDFANLYAGFLTSGSIIYADTDGSLTETNPGFTWLGSILNVDGTVEADVLSLDVPGGGFLLLESGDYLLLETSGDKLELEISGSAGQVTYLNANGDISHDSSFVWDVATTALTVSGTVSLTGLSVQVTTQTNTDYTALVTDDVILVNTGAVTRTISIPSAATLDKKKYYIKKIDAGAGLVTLDPAGSETIDGDLTPDITAQYESFTIVSDGSNWHVI